MKNRPLAVASVRTVSTASSKSGILASPLRLLLDLVVTRADQPKKRMNDEECKRSGEQQVHKQPHEINLRIQLAITRIGMRLILHKADVRALVARAARLHQVGLIDGRLRIRRRQNFMRAMAVPAPSRLNVSA